MTKTKNALFALPILGAILFGGMMVPSFAMPNTFICDGLVQNQTIDSNVLVPKGETCILDTVTVNGDIKVKKDANFTIATDGTINGNLGANGANNIEITELNMVGDISIVNSGDVEIEQASHVQGSVFLKGNDFVDLFELAIDDNLSIIQNDIIEISDVGVGGNMEILRNGPVTSDTGDFTPGISGNATCLMNESITGEFFVVGNNNGCPTP